MANSQLSGNSEYRSLVGNYIHINTAEVEFPVVFHQKGDDPYGVVLPISGSAEDMYRSHIRELFSMYLTTFVWSLSSCSLSWTLSPNWT